NYAVRSGRYAAEAALEAKASGRTGAPSLAGYGQRLEASGLLADFREFEGLDRVKWNPRFYTVYPRLATELLHRRLRADGEPKPNLVALVDRLRREEQLPIRALLSDGWDGLREL
ncbi:MAG TPA: hypothetical protein VGU43_06230, partial [Thermoplasmata archaeon]|nr:hypothetical protein [Thermoplasmata archaeon]